jgi:hypothetical protein
VESKDVNGSILSLDKDNIAVLDSKNGYIYTLSISKKSLEKTTAAEIKSASLLGIFKDVVVFINPSQGIFQAKAGKVKKVADKDSDWGDLADLKLYNGNIYALDRGKDEIYRYTMIEAGYSNKSSYFKSGQAMSLKNATSLAIDSSLYISLKSEIVKFTAGVKDDFATSFPDPTINIAKVYTNKDIEKVYALDKTKGSLYVLGKNGTYEREIKSSILVKATDFVIFENVAYVLADQKIYKVGVE